MYIICFISLHLFLVPASMSGLSTDGLPAPLLGQSLGLTVDEFTPQGYSRVVGVRGREGLGGLVSGTPLKVVCVCVCAYMYVVAVGFLKVQKLALHGKSLIEMSTHISKRNCSPFYIPCGAKFLRSKIFAVWLS